jgi:endonuclease/exonuclease/phosphatase family metal-dependent hydrolase
MRAVIAAMLALGVLGACDLTRGAPAPDAPVVDGFAPPQGMVVPAVGSAATLDVACWNIENFPLTAQTPSDVADLITSLDLDVVVVEEIASEDAWAELLARLPEHDGVLSTHVYTATSYQKIGIIYRTGTVTLDQIELLFQADTNPFPRPPLHAHLRFDDGAHAPVELDLVGLHLKAGVTSDDIARRTIAITELDAWQRARTADPGTIFLGDWNQPLATYDGPTVWAPITAAPDLYTIQTQAASTAGTATFLPAGSMIDHIVSTAAAAPILGAPQLTVPALERSYNPYAQVSDHLPVVLSIPLAAR